MRVIELYKLIVSVTKSSYFHWKQETPYIKVITNPRIFKNKTLIIKILQEGDTIRAKMSSKTNNKKGHSKARSQGYWKSSGTVVCFQSSTNFCSGIEKDKHGRNPCYAYTEDTPIDWDGLVEDVMECEGKKANEK